MLSESIRSAQREERVAARVTRSPVRPLQAFRWNLRLGHSLDSISPRSSEADDNDEARMTNDEGRPNARITKERSDASFRHSDLLFLHTRTRHSLSEIINDSARTH